MATRRWMAEERSGSGTFILFQLPLPSSSSCVRRDISARRPGRRFWNLGDTTKDTKNGVPNLVLPGFIYSPSWIRSQSFGMAQPSVTWVARWVWQKKIFGNRQMPPLIYGRPYYMCCCWPPPHPRPPAATTQKREIGQIFFFFWFVL